MIVRRLSLTDFRNYAGTTLELDDGLTVVTGDNGHGKTNLVEALSWLATLESFRGAPPEALVRAGADRAVLRAEIVHEDGRQILAEAELPRTGRHRVQVYRQRLQRARDLLGVTRVPAGVKFGQARLLVFFAYAFPYLLARYMFIANELKFLCFANT